MLKRHLHRSAFTTLLAVIGAAVCVAAAAKLPSITVVPPPPETNGAAYILIDGHTGEVLAEKNPDLRRAPASLTKIMTALVVFNDLQRGNIALDDQVRISENAWRTGGSRSFLPVGSTVSVEDLLNGMIVQSGNDAAVAIAEYIAGDEAAFAGVMNQYAAAIGMSGSSFDNATGLPSPDEYTTARDMAMLSQTLIHQFPDYYRWYAKKEFSYNGISQRNRNRLLWIDSSVDGIKTGHTSEAGFNLVASAQRDNMRLIAVVLGEESDQARNNAANKLLQYGFRFFDTAMLIKKNQIIDTVPIADGEKTTIAVGSDTDVARTLRRDTIQQVTITPRIEGTLTAPVAAGQRIGDIAITIEDELIDTVPLMAMESVAKVTLWRKIKRMLPFTGEE